MDAFNLGVWVCIQGFAVDAYSCFIGLYDLPYVRLPLSMSVSDIGFLVYATCIMCLVLSLSILMHAVYIGKKPCQCAIAHQTQNFARLFPWKCDIFLSYSHRKSLVRIVFCVLWCTWPKMVADFCHESRVKCVGASAYDGLLGFPKSVGSSP